MTHRGETAANHRVEGISVFVRVRPTSEQEEAGDSSQQQQVKKEKLARKNEGDDDPIHRAARAPNRHPNKLNVSCPPIESYSGSPSWQPFTAQHSDKTNESCGLRGERAA